MGQRHGKGAGASTVVVLYEHPTWSVELINRLQRRLNADGIDVVAIDVGAPPAVLPDPERVALWINRVNVMPSSEQRASVAAAAQHLLLGLEAADAPVLNGFRSHALGLSKSAQAALFTVAGVATPVTVAVSSPDEVTAAAERIGYPVLTKPNIGGSGRGIARYDDAHGLARAVAAGSIDLGIDGTGVVQAVVPSADGVVHRVEVLDGEIFYATNQASQDGTFNYCAVDGCSVNGSADGEGSGPRIVEADPTQAAAAIAIVAAAGADLAGVEYLLSADDGRAVFYDFNPYSNFVSGQNDELGFDPLDRYIDVVVSRLSAKPA